METIEQRAVESLTPYGKNSRVHSPEQVAQLAASIETFGFTIPVLVDEAGGIIAGHGRVLAAQKLGRATVPVIVAAGWPEDRKRAYVIADNKLAENASWDSALLGLELADLQLSGFDLALTGFAPADVASIIARASQGEADPDEAPEPPVRAVSAVGDVWLLGGHRVRCGDSTDADTVVALLDGAKPHLMVTDPPYGVNYTPGWRHTARRSTGELLSVGKHSMGKVQNDDRADWREAWALFPGGVAYVWHSGLHAAAVQESLEAAGFAMRSQIIWNKNVMIISRGHYHFKHEPCWYAVRKGATATWAGDRKQTSVWDIPIVHLTAGDVDDGKNAHGTQKPVECMRRPILNNSKGGDAVYDPFLGSGTTLVAAEMEGRVCYGLELDPAYVDVIVTRWQNLTGKVAMLEATGATFEETKAQRHGD